MGNLRGRSNLTNVKSLNQFGFRSDFYHKNRWGAPKWGMRKILRALVLGLADRNFRPPISSLAIFNTARSQGRVVSAGEHFRP
jgi:hypothetical protein